MNIKPIDAIAKAILYEGYMLYPYRPSSVKNRQRFNFGVLYPKAYSDAQLGSDAWSMQTECLMEGGALSAIDVRVRFLKLVDRSVRAPAPTADPSNAMSAFVPTQRLEVDGRVFTPWQEAVECEIVVPPCNLDALAVTALEWKFELPAKDEPELLRDATGKVMGLFARRQELVQGVVEIKADRAGDGLSKIQIQVRNLTSAENVAGENGRDAGLMRSLISAHTMLGAVDGRFVSLLEPPEAFREIAAGCQNVDTWPVLVGSDGDRDTMLSSPIILYDYPQIAPESPGDLFDGTEIDEILALRILTMTDDEKSEMRQTDERARKMLDRTEALPMEDLVRLHGTLRELRSLRDEAL